MTLNKTSEKEIFHKIIFSPRERVSLFRQIPVNRQGFVLCSFSKYIQKKILEKLKDEEIIRMLRYLDPNSTIRLLRNIKEDRRRKRILKTISSEIREKIEFLLRFDPETALGLINLNYVEVEKGSSFKEVAEIVRNYEKKTRKFPEILVVKDGFLIGELEGYALFAHKGNEKIDKYIRKVPSITHKKNTKEVIELFRKNPHNQIVVLNEDKSILGIIYSEDILNLINKEAGIHLSKFAGIREEENIYDSALTKVKNRYQWLIINLGTAFLAAGVVGFFQQTISKWVLLAVYMPIIAGMGGNAGTQTLAVVVRGLALKEIDLKTVKGVLVNEVIAGAINGAINGCIVAIVATMFNKSPLLGLIVAIAMVVNLIIAGFFGTIIPLLMKRIGKDPASSATIFITTATDVCGFLVFLGMARLLL